jgi:lipoprotein-anchoring transpeptidase ErfK/SrfK
MQYRHWVALNALFLSFVLECTGARPPLKRGGSPTALAIEDATHDAQLGPGASGSRVVRAQILLDRARFSPGEIDGQYGEDLGVAIRGYQANHGLQATGTIDPPMWSLLQSDAGPLVMDYTITAADVRGPFRPLPKDVQEKAQMKWLGYESVAEALGERFHIAPKLLVELNPGKELTRAGEQIAVPNVKHAAARPASRIVVSKSKRTVTAYGAGDTLLAQYPATIGGEHDPLPIGDWIIAAVQRDPWFYYQPGRFWNANPADAKVKLAPGPNNPVGLVWMGLSKAHYGIHGTPDPGHVGHNESYGCIRLTNWDAADLSHMVRRGTPAILEE